MRLRFIFPPAKDTIMLSGDKEQVEKAADVIDHMQKRLIKRGKLTDADVDEMIMQTKSQHRTRRRRGDNGIFTQRGY